MLHIIKIDSLSHLSIIFDLFKDFRSKPKGVIKSTVYKEVDSSESSEDEPKPQPKANSKS